MSRQPLSLLVLALSFVFSSVCYSSDGGREVGNGADPDSNHRLRYRTDGGLTPPRIAYLPLAEVECLESEDRNAILATAIYSFEASGGEAWIAYAVTF